MRKEAFALVSALIFTVLASSSCVQQTPAGNVPSQSPSAQAAAENAQRTQDLELCGFFKDLYDKTPLDCPERFAVNRIRERAGHRDAFKALRSKDAPEADKAKARKELSSLRDEILLGENWPFKTREEVKIPHAASAPALDGDFSSPAWREALLFRDEFHLDSTELKKTGAEWRAMWDENYLYIGAWLPDEDIHSVAFEQIKGKGPWDFDCFECFVMPSMRMKVYWELVINPENKVFDGLHRNNSNGGFIPQNYEDIAGLKSFAKIVKTPSGSDKGYIVQAAIPFKELPNYMLGNKPEPGQELFFMFVRTQDGERHSPRPFLYDGHNIFGFFHATLAK